MAAVLQLRVYCGCGPPSAGWLGAPAALGAGFDLATRWLQLHRHYEALVTPEQAVRYSQKRRQTSSGRIEVACMLTGGQDAARVSWWRTSCWGLLVTSLAALTLASDEGEVLCRIEILHPQTGDSFVTGSGVTLELGLVDCPDVRSGLEGRVLWNGHDAASLPDFSREDAGFLSLEMAPVHTGDSCDAFCSGHDCTQCSSRC